MEKPKYFELHEEEDRKQFDSLREAIGKLPCKEDLDEAIEAAVEKHVNGKIKSLDEKLTKYIEGDETWKLTAKPYVEAGHDALGFYKILKGLLGFLVLVGASIAAGLAIKSKL